MTDFVVDPKVDLGTIFVTSPFSTGGYQVNPWYCATVAAAQRLMAYLQSKLGLTVTMSFTWPEGAFAPGSPFQQSGTVPYLTFPSAVNPLNGFMRAGDVLLEYYLFPNNAADATLQKWLSLQ